MKQKSLKIYQTSFQENLDYVLHEYDECLSLKNNIESWRFWQMNDFADLFVRANLTSLDTNPDFLCPIVLDSTTEEELKSYLIKNKNFFFKYLVTKDIFTPTHLYQLYLQYIPYELSEVEKSIFLDGYIKMLTDLKGSIISNQKRLLLEEKLHLNVD